MALSVVLLLYLLAQLHPLGDLVVKTRTARDRQGHVASARGQDADETGHAAVVHTDAGHVGADIDDGLVSLRVEIECLVAGPDGPHHRERREVDADGLELGGHGRLDERGDHALVRGHQEDPLHPSPALLHLAERIEVQHGLVGGHRDEFLDLESQRVPQLLLGQPRQGDLANHHALVPDPELRLLALDPALVPQLPEGCGDHVGLANLAGLDGAGRKGDLGGADHDGDVPRRDLRHADGRGAHVHAHLRLGH